MKKIFPVISLILVLEMTCSYAEEENPTFESDESQEIALLESSPLMQPQIAHESFDFSEATIVPKRKSAFLAASMSGFIPGLGQIYLGDFKTGVSLFGSSALLTGIGVSEIKNDTIRNSSFMTGQNISFYSAYAAYRDARIYNHQRGYNYEMPINSIKDLMFAPFQWSIIKKPEVWGAFLGALAIGTGLSYFISSEANVQIPLSASGSMFPLLAFPIGIGEESYFRGYLQSTLSEVLTPWGGIITSSILFGAIHAFNAVDMTPEAQFRYYTIALPFITSFGVYFGWLTHKNHSLKEGVALHSWYDFTLFLLSYSAVHSASIGKPGLAFSFSF